MLCLRWPEYSISYLFSQIYINGLSVYRYLLMIQHQSQICDTTHNINKSSHSLDKLTSVKFFKLHP